MLLKVNLLLLEKHSIIIEEQIKEARIIADFLHSYYKNLIRQNNEDGARSCKRLYDAASRQLECIIRRKQTLDSSRENLALVNQEVSHILNEALINLGRNNS